MSPQPLAYDLTEVVIAPPCPSIPYYHVRGRLVTSAPAPFEILAVKANGVKLNTVEIRDGGAPLAFDKPYPYSWPLFAESRLKEFNFRDPLLIARLDWANGRRYEFSVELARTSDKAKQLITRSAAAPASGGYWNESWKFYKSLVVSEEFGLDRQDEPVEFTLLFYPDQISNLGQELRIVRWDPRTGPTVLPSQVYKISRYTEQDTPRKDADGTVRPPYWLPTVAARVVVPVSLKARTSAVLLAFYGNPRAARPSSKSDLAVAGQGLGLTITNALFQARLHPRSGLLDELVLRGRPKDVLKHKLETNGAIHWNPDAYSPPRPWMHASDWNPPEESSVVAGPVMAVVSREGIMPGMPEIELSVTYKFYSRLPYFVMTSAMDVVRDVPLQALRNGEMVIDHKLIDQAAWKEPASDGVQTLRLDTVPLLTEIRLPLDTEWLAFTHSQSRVGFGGIPFLSSNSSSGIEPATVNPYLYITRGPWVYWTRVLAAPYLTPNIQQIVPIPAGNRYLESWAYLPFEVGPDSRPFGLVDELARRLAHPLRTTVVDERDGRVRIPDEIYTDPAKTGWEKRESR
jgi:hypothetical protein